MDLKWISYPILKFITFFSLQINLSGKLKNHYDVDACGPLILDWTAQALGENARPRPRVIDQCGPLILDPTAHVESRAARLNFARGRKAANVDRRFPIQRLTRAAQQWRDF